MRDAVYKVYMGATFGFTCGRKVVVNSFPKGIAQRSGFNPQTPAPEAGYLSPGHESWTHRKQTSFKSC